MSKTCSFPSENTNHFLASRRTAWGNGPWSLCSLCTPIKKGGQRYVPLFSSPPNPYPRLTYLPADTYTRSIHRSQDLCLFNPAQRTMAGAECSFIQQASTKHILHAGARLQNNKHLVLSEQSTLESAKAVEIALSPWRWDPRGLPLTNTMRSSSQGLLLYRRGN